MASMKADSLIDPRVTVAVLAGGRGERLGGLDKGLQPLRGKPLIESVLAGVRKQHHGALMIVANRNIERYRELAPTISDRVPGFAGPLAGIAAALEQCSTPWLAILPVDCPAPPPDLMMRLLAALRLAPASVLVAHDGQRRQPLFALCSKTLGDDAANAAAEGIGVWQWQDRNGAIEIDFSDCRASFHNLNSALDFQCHAQQQAS